MRRPHLDLLVVTNQRFEMLRSLIRRCELPGGRMSERSIEMEVRGFEHTR